MDIILEKSIEPITTQRLIIRPLSEQDFQSWGEGLNEEAPKSRSVSHFEAAVPQAQRSQSDFLERLSYYRNLRRLDRFYHYGIFDRVNPKCFVGALSLTVLERLIIQRAVIGYHIFSSHLRQGFGSESVKALLTSAFKDLKFHRLEALIETSNRASIGLAENVGMRREGTLKKAIYSESNHGKWIDAYLYSALAEDFGIKNMKPTIRMEIKEH